MEPGKIFYPTVKRTLKYSSESSNPIPQDKNEIIVEPEQKAQSTISPVVRSYKPIDASALLNYYTNQKNIKVVESTCPFETKICLKDASFSQKMKEDDLYLKDSEALVRLRRGNSLAVFRPPGAPQSVHILRRGLPKFFDLRQEHIRVMKGETNQQDLIKFGATCAFEYRVIMGALTEKLNNNCLINLYRSGKANGENAQISSITFPGLGSFWVACSKNVSLVFNNKSQIDLYTEERFSYARLISKAWIAFVETLKPELLDKVKEVTRDNTLVGEFCGNSLCQHLVRYTEEQIIFYAIVPKDCGAACWPMKKTFGFLDEVGLAKVQLEAVEGIKSLKELGSALEKMNSRLACSSVQEEGEGSVAYLEVCDPELGEWEVISMCKLKTLEYRFLRKMREKIKKQIRMGGSVSSTISKFEKECKELVQEYPEDVRPGIPGIKGYSDLLETGVNIVQMNNLPVELLEKCFLDLLVVIRSCNSEKRAPTKPEISKLLKAISAHVKAEEAEEGAKKEWKPSPNIVYLDIPGLMNPVTFHRLLEQDPSLELVTKFGYDQKPSKTPTFRIVNLNKTMVSPKKLKYFTYIMLPMVPEALDHKLLGRDLVKRVASFFKGRNDGTLPAIDFKWMDDYLQHCLGDLDKLSNIEQSVFVSMSKIGKVKKEKGGIIEVEVSKEGFEARIIDCVKKIMVIHEGRGKGKDQGKDQEEEVMADKIEKNEDSGEEEEYGMEDNEN